MADWDFIGFTYNGKHSVRDLKIYRTSNSGRYDDNLTATMTDKTADVPGGDGQYYFGTTFKNRTFTVPYAFDNLTESDLRTIKQTFDGEGIHDLVFDEAPYKAWAAKVTGTASMKHLCFEIDGERVYRGEGSITFTCYYPFARTPKKLWVPNYKEGEDVITHFSYEDRDGRNFKNYCDAAYPNREEWKIAADLDESEGKINGEYLIKGDKSTGVKVGFTNYKDSRELTKLRLSTDVVVSLTTKITLTTSSSVVWDTNTGLITFGEITPGDSPLNQKNPVILPYTGLGCHKFAPGTKVFPGFLGLNGKNEEKWYECFYYIITIDPGNHVLCDIDYQFIYN